MTSFGKTGTADAKAESRSYWDGRSAGFASHCGKGVYPQEFIKRLNLEGSETIMDMGCGAGTLAIPLAKQGHHVLACDFSSGMLQQLQNKASEEGLDNIETKQLDWDDDWMEQGVEAKSCDIAIASRSILTDKLDDILAKLESVARSKVAITVPAGPAPYVDKYMLEYLGYEVPANRVDFQVVETLVKQGKYPMVSDLFHIRGISFDSHEDLVRDQRNMLGGNSLSDSEQQKFDECISKHEIVEEVDGKTIYKMDYSLKVIWGLIIWNPDGEPIL